MSEILAMLGAAALFALFGVMSRRAARLGERRECACGSVQPDCGACRGFRGVRETRHGKP